MYTINQCPCCNSCENLSFPAFIAPFIRNYVLGENAPQLCRLLECKKCAFRYFSLRFDEHETETLYHNYRGEMYFQARHKFELWYTKKFNYRIGHDADEIKKRKVFLRNIISRHVDIRNIENVLDFGGDEGQFIPNDIGTNKYVYELSDVVPLSGIVKLDDSSIHSYKYDLIMLCHVLEHCSNPSIILGKLKDLVKKTAYFYFEVPFERSSIPPFWASVAYEKYLQTITSSNVMTVFMDFASTAVRRFRGRELRWGGVKFHEHINFFNEKSLSQILLNAGFQIIDCSVDDYESYPLNARKIGCLASFGI